MTTTQVVETSVTVNNSPIQEYVHPDDQTQPTNSYAMSRSSERILIWCYCGTKAEKFELHTGNRKSQLATPINFIRDTSAGKLDSFRLDFVSVNDEMWIRDQWLPLVIKIVICLGSTVPWSAFP